MFKFKHNTETVVKAPTHNEWEIVINARLCPFSFTTTMDNKFLWMCPRTRTTCEKKNCPFTVEKYEGVK